MQNSHGKRSQKIWTEIVFSNRSRKNNLKPFSWGGDNSLPSLSTLEMPMRIFLASCPCQARPAKSRCQSPHLVPVPLATPQDRCSRLRGAAKLLGSAPDSNNSSGKLFFSLSSSSGSMEKRSQNPANKSSISRGSK